MNIRVDLSYTIKDGTEVVFRSPVDCSQVTGLKVYYTENGVSASKEFVFADAHGNNVGDIPHLFAENVVVKVILDVTTGMAFVQNADTNAYIERTFIKTVNGVAPDENGNVNVEGGSGGGGSGEAGADGFSPIANVTQTGSGAVISITDKSGTTTAAVFNGKDGKDGYTPVKGVDYFDGAPGKDGVDGKDGAKGDKGDPGEKGDTGAPGADGAKGDKGDKGDTGAQGNPGKDGADGKDGANGKDGVSATHSWNGTTLTITSASGTSSANLKGEKGDKGDQGIQGIQGIQGEKGETGAAGSNGTNGKDGANGTSVTVKSVSESTADGGSNVVTFSDGKTLTVKNGSKGSTGSKGDTGETGAKGDKGDKGDTGATGATGQRGTGLLAVTTAPSGYTTEVGGITPKYRMALSTIKTQAGVTEVLLGDTIRYSYYHYPIAYLDSSYAYFTTRVSIRGATGAAGTTPVKGTDYFTDADKEEFLAGVDAVRYVPQNLTEAQKAQVRANIGASAGEDVEFADSIEWLNAYGDTNKKYVLPDGYIYTYTQKSVNVTHNANDGTGFKNVRPTASAGSNKEANTTKNGVFTTAPIQVDKTWSSATLNISGLSTLVPTFYASLYVYFFDASGTFLFYRANNQIVSAGTTTPLTSAAEVDLPLPVSVDLLYDKVNSGKKDLLSSNNVGYIRVTVGVHKTAAISDADIANLVINVDRLNSTQTVSEWSSTGQLHSNDKATQQNSADIATLKEDVATLKAIAGASAGGSGAKWYAIGDSITYGLYSTSASDYSQPVIGKRWVDYVAQYNGYTLTNLGVSGSGFVTGTTFRTVVDRNNFASVNLVTIMLGINDWKNEAAVNKVGTMSDAVGTAYTDKIIPELRYGIEKIIGDNPYCKIILITPINAKIGSRGTESTNWAYEFSGSITPCGSLKNFNDKLKEVCEYYGIQVIDMTNSSVVNRKSITTVLPDGIHPNLDCYKALGLELARKITFA